MNIEQPRSRCLADLLDDACRGPGDRQRPGWDRPCARRRSAGRVRSSARPPLRWARSRPDTVARCVPHRDLARSLPSPRGGHGCSLRSMPCLLAGLFQMDASRAASGNVPPAGRYHRSGLAVRGEAGALSPDRWPRRSHRASSPARRWLHIALSSATVSRSCADRVPGGAEVHPEVRVLAGHPA